MILENFKNHETYPFNRFYESANQYAFSQQYFLSLLRSVDGFQESEWKPIPRKVDIKDDQYMGLLVEIFNVEEKKAISLSVIGREGVANMLYRENQFSKKEIKYTNDDREKSDLPKIAGNPTMRDIVDNLNQSYAGPVNAQVDSVQIYIDDFEEEVLFEKLFLGGEISEQAENKLVDVLEIFLKPGSNADTINDMFFPAE